MIRNWKLREFLCSLVFRLFSLKLRQVVLAYWTVQTPLHFRQCCWQLLGRISSAKINLICVIIYNNLLHIFGFMNMSQFMCVLVMIFSHMYQNQSNILNMEISRYNTSEIKCDFHIKTQKIKHFSSLHILQFQVAQVYWNLNIFMH